MSTPRALLPLLAALALLACSGPDQGDATESSTSSGGLSAGTTTMMTTSSSSTTAESTTTGSTTVDPSTSGTGSESATLGTTDPTTGGGECVPVECPSEGKILACGDCMDNDSDGLVDLADLECISPCDDREDSFATGLPGDNMDPCKQDCFFDGNSGGGKGDCAWNLACDPMGPGGDKCPYNPDLNNCPAEQSMECVDSCQTPSGCDCFGCCTVTVDGVAHDVYLGDLDCSVETIDSCAQCTKNDECDDPCEPENCEICFGETEPPPGCEEPMCENEMLPCTIDKEGNHDCPDGFFCSTGCCWGLIPG